MAKVIESGPNAGLLSGKVGEVVYVIKNGKNFTRKRPRKQQRTAAPAQICQRQKFGFAQQFAKNFLEVAKLGFRQYQYYAFHKFSSGLHKSLENDKGSCHVNMETLHLSCGDLPVPEIAFLGLEKNRIDLKWKPLAFADGNTTTLVMVICNAGGTAVDYYTAEAGCGEIKTGFCAFEMQHVYTFYTSKDRATSSETLYLGSLPAESEATDG